jgi:hypothetical protein
VSRTGLNCAGWPAKALTAGQQKPEHEKQVRPLVGLGLEEGSQAWTRAVEKAFGCTITAGMVKAAVHELLAERNLKPAIETTRRDKAEHYRTINAAIGQLLVLLSQKEDHRILAEKVEVLHRHIQGIFATAGGGNVAPVSS